MDHLQLVPVARGVSDFEARILTAQLGAEGIIWELRGADPVYPLGNVDVLVPVDELDEARSVLLPPAGDASGLHAVPFGSEDTEVDERDLPDRAPYRRRWWFVAAVLAALASFGFVRMVTMGVNTRPSVTTESCGSHPEAVAGGLTVACG